MVSVAEVKSRIAYVDPPTDMIPVKGIYDDWSGAWDRLLNWFEAHTKDKLTRCPSSWPNNMAGTIPQAYMYSDGLCLSTASRSTTKETIAHTTEA